MSLCTLNIHHTHTYIFYIYATYIHTTLQAGSLSLGTGLGYRPWTPSQAIHKRISGAAAGTAEETVRAWASVIPKLLH